MTTQDDRGADQARAQFESIKEMVENLFDWQAAAEAEGWTGPHKDKHGVTYFEDTTDGQTYACADWRDLCKAFDIKPDELSEDGECTIHEDALSVEVRSGWHTPDAEDGDAPEEYRILLCTGGPAAQIIGRLSGYGEPETARLQHQDWFTPWTDWAGNCGAVEDTLLAYARCFYFGE